MAPKMKICGRCEVELIAHLEFHSNGKGKYKPICIECEAEAKKAKLLGYGPDLRVWEREGWRLNFPLSLMLDEMRRHPEAIRKHTATGWDNWPTDAESYASWLAVNTLTLAEYRGRIAVLHDLNEKDFSAPDKYLPHEPWGLQEVRHAQEVVPEVREGAGG